MLQLSMSAYLDYRPSVGLVICGRVMNVFVQPSCITFFSFIFSERLHTTSHTYSISGSGLYENEFDKITKRARTKIMNRLGSEIEMINSRYSTLADIDDNGLMAMINRIRLDSNYEKE